MSSDRSPPARDGTGDAVVADGARTTPAAVRGRLDRVTDPELDTSIVELGYVEEIGIDPSDTADGDSGGDAVFVAFTLPTAWCSPAFAWMMASDAREAVASLPTVATVGIELREHMHEREINRGIDGDLSFGEAFPDADGDVAPVRAELDRKARIARQHDATDALLAAGLSGEQIVDLTADDVAFDEARGSGDGGTVTVWLRDGAVGVPVDAEPLVRYREKAVATGLLDDGHPELFRTPEGDPIGADAFETVRRRTRLAKVNMGGQGTVCDALDEARHAEDRPPLSTFSE